MRDSYPFEASEAGLCQQIWLCLAERDAEHWQKGYRFHDGRRWKFDIANPRLRIACEYQGGLFMQRKGGHQTVKGMRRDWEKFNEAQMMGWIVLLFGPDETRTGNAVHMVERAVARRLGEYERA